MKTFQELLRELNACEDARMWARRKTIEQVVEECPRGDWLLWLAQRVDIGLQPLPLAGTAYAVGAAYAAAAYAYANAADARIQNQKQTADICREHIGQLIINKVNELLKN